MRSFLLFSLCTVLSIAVYGQRMTELDREISINQQKRISLSSELSSLNSKYPKFKIIGDIKDRDKDILQIWGVALPVSENYYEYGAMLEKGNIIVLNPNEFNINYNIYANGEHYFRGKQYGKNAVGADVPANVYGDISDPQAGYRMYYLKNEIDRLDQIVADQKEEKRKLLVSQYVSEGDKLFAEKNYESSIDYYIKALNLDGNKVYEYKIKIADAYCAIGDQKIVEKNYEAAVSNYGLAVEYNYQDKFTEKEALAIEELAKISYKEERYLETIKYYEKELKIFPSRSGNVNPPLARAYLELGKSNIAEKLEATKNIITAYHLDNSLESEANDLLSIFRRSPVLYGISSIIPGLGQFLQGKNTTGTIQISLFSASLITAFLLNNSSKNTYSDYEKATNTNDAKNLYKQANDRKLYSNISLGLAGGVVLWSILDSFFEAKDYNTPYYLSQDSNLIISPLLTEGSYLLILKLSL
jgi:tetratricopeptide (TPR) repeat protein